MLWTFATAGPKLLLFSTSMLAFLVDFQRHDLGLLVLHSLTSDGEDVCNTADNQGWAIVIFKQLNSLTVAVGNQFIIGS